MNFDNSKFKLDSMLSQQTKLIDYLQMKVENPVKKKKVSVLVSRQMFRLVFLFQDKCQG